LYPRSTDTLTSRKALDTVRAHTRGAFELPQLPQLGRIRREAAALIGQTDLCRSVALESRTEEVPALGKRKLVFIRRLHREVPSCDVGACRISSCGLLGALRLGLSVKRTNAGYLASHQFDLPYRDSWLASTYQPLCNPSCECPFIRIGRSVRRKDQVLVVCPKPCLTRAAALVRGLLMQRSDQKQRKLP
jgi:hypothetical protein